MQYHVEIEPKTIPNRGLPALYLEHIAVEKVAWVVNGVPADAMSIDRTLWCNRPLWVIADRCTKQLVEGAYDGRYLLAGDGIVDDAPLAPGIHQPVEPQAGELL
jgi:hypothetical protein